MHFISAKSTITDPYRAGFELGTAIAPLAPEVVILFASISYKPDFSDFFEALYDALGSNSIIIFGGTGDGIYETSGAENYGVSALGINSGGKVNWTVSMESGVAADSFGAAKKCARKALMACPDANCFRMVLADGVHTDGHALINGIMAEIPGLFFGGLTGDDRKFTSSKVFVNGLEYEDVVAILCGSGEIGFAINAASGWTPVGNTGVVEDLQGCEIRSISGLPAQEFMALETGKPLLESDLGVVPLAAYMEGSSEHFCLRTSSHMNPDTGSITTFGSVDAGCAVRVCTASREDVLRGVEDTLDGLSPESLGFMPSAAIIISCAGRKWLMSDRGEKELELLQQRLGNNIKLVGFPSFGEISPFRRSGNYTAVSFHNVTFVVCLIG
ncbi:MAG: FIST N-terminal domain-containing protein [Deltaproteobacteria bacterium]